MLAVTRQSPRDLQDEERGGAFTLEWRDDPYSVDLSREFRDVLFNASGRCEGVACLEPDGCRRDAFGRWIVDASGQACIIGRRVGVRGMRRGTTRSSQS